MRILEADEMQFKVGFPQIPVLCLRVVHEPTRVTQKIHRSSMVIEIN